MNTIPRVLGEFTYQGARYRVVSVAAGLGPQAVLESWSMDAMRQDAWSRISALTQLQHSGGNLFNFFMFALASLGSE